MKNHAYTTLFIILLTLTTLACGGGSPSAAPAGGQAEPAPGGQSAGGVANAPAPGGNAGRPGGANGNGAGIAGLAGNGGEGSVVNPGSILENNDLPVQTDENGNISISVTDTQVNEAMAAQSAQSSETSQIENVVVAFTSAGIVFTGDVSGQQLYILFWPYVENGTVQLDVVEATMAGMDVPDQIVDEAETAVNRSLSEAMSGMPDRITLQSITVTDGLMTIVARLNE